MSLIDVTPKVKVSIFCPFLELTVKVFREIVAAACLLSASGVAAQTPFVQSDLNVHVASLRDAPMENRTAVFVVHTNSKLPPVEGPFIALVRHEKPLETLSLSDIKHDNSVSFFIEHSNGAVNSLNIGGLAYRVRGPSEIVAELDNGSAIKVAWAPVVGGSASYLTIFQNDAVLLFIGSKLIANISGPSAKELQADISSGNGLTQYTLGVDGRLKAGGYALSESTPIGILNTDVTVPCVDKKFKIFTTEVTDAGETKKTPLDQESLLFLTTHKSDANGENKKPYVVALHYDNDQNPVGYKIRATGKDECLAEQLVK